MRLQRLLPRLQQHPALRAVLDGGNSLSAITPARPYALAALHAALRRPILLLVARPTDARGYVNELSAWADDPNAVLLFPETDALPYDRLPNDADKLADRLGALQRLAGLDPDAKGPPLVVASVRAAIDLLVEPDTFRAAHRVIRRGDRLPPADLAGEWLRLGFEPSPVVDQPGLFSRRGGILDVFPPGGYPVRIELWGDEVDTIRVFDPATQRSTEQLDEARVGPAHEVLPCHLPHLSLDLRGLRPQFADPFARDLGILRDGQQAFPAIEFYRGYLGAATLLDYLPSDGVLVLEDPTVLSATGREFEEHVEQLHADLLERGEIPSGLARPYRPWRSTLEHAPPARRITLAFDPDAESLPFEHAAKYGGRLDLFLSGVSDARSVSGRTPHPPTPGAPPPTPAGGPVPAQPSPAGLEAPSGGSRGAQRPLAAGDVPPLAVIVSQQADRLSELLAEEHGIQARPTPELEDDGAPVALVNGLLREGWVADELGLALFTDSEIFGWTKQRRAAPRRLEARRQAAEGAAREAFVADLQPGDLVVHVDHGIARYGGLVQTILGATETQQGGKAEYLLLNYAAGDNLYVPISQADRVSRYVGSGDAEPSLTRLGSGEWLRAKAKVRRSVRDLAHELMDLYGARAALEGHAYPPDTPWQLELEGSFPFEETPDQVAAIHDVKADMERPKPMDRLLVGDVGFGKTEVALRAAFKAVQDGRQVAVLVPTTVLAQQHYNTFRDRLNAFPIRVEMLSRFRSEKEQRQILEGLAKGGIDIVIGTHRLVQRDVTFKALGLVIIDEEQRFGVAHKERLKQLRKEVDVLTLTATPIPRTLHMGLVGVRDMSILETPPEARLPVRTYVAEYDEGMIAEAILREIDRGGQVYVVHNRVQGIDSIASKLHRLVPEARIGVAHGQMPEEQLEQTMLHFVEGELDVLVCTTIIESGLDIPNVNTLIVNNAHRFGLAQLYQLRGRVGRSAVRAYAYLLYGRDLSLSEVASERLKTIFEATELGAGMRIAMKDLEIRGAGNLLGAAQSGHIAAVGFDLYTRLLAEQVELLRARQDGHAPLPFEKTWTSLDLPVAAFVPPEYVSDDPVRLRLYQRFSAVEQDTELSALVSELEDRFGALPEPAQNLVYLTSLRLRATEAGVEALTATEHEVIVKFDTLPALNIGRLERAAGVALKRGSNQLRFERGQGQAWMGRLYQLVSALVQREEIARPEPVAEYASAR